MRIGFGYDIHKLISGRPFILGGVSIPFEKGLLGHSDADVLCHAVADALLGAAALGDIGEHFPDTDPKYKDCSSIELLKQVKVMIQEAGYIVKNIDTVVVAEAPRLTDHKKTMSDKIEESLHLPPGTVSIKATTQEKLGPVGRSEAIAVYAVVLLENKGS